MVAEEFTKPLLDGNRIPTIGLGTYQSKEGRASYKLDSV